MKKNKIKVYGLVILMTISLLVIIIMQTAHIKHSYNRSNRIFDRVVFEAATSTLYKLQKQDAILYTYNKLSNQNNNADSVLPIIPDLLSFEINATVFDSKPGHKMRISTNFSPTSTYRIEDLESYRDNNTVSNTLPMVEKFMQHFFLGDEIEFVDLFNQLEKEFLRKQIPIEKRYNPKSIRRILKEYLEESGFSELEFEFAILDTNNKIRVESENFAPNTLSECYQFNIMPNNIFPDSYYFAVYFPQKKQYITTSLYIQLIFSILLILLFTTTFGFSLYALIKQKKITQIKNDFINNMTHEIKTPIATIKLAAASLRNEKTRANTDAHSAMLDIITQETNKMDNHIEQVLQMSMLDKQSLNLNLEKENINALVSEAIDDINLVIQEKNGVINSKLNNADTELIVDKSLLKIAINNILDNAIKYCKTYPDITVTTFKKGEKFYISVADKGIGMSKEATKKIFDRFYRVYSGNIHNIKGFGVGLNYAKEIVMAHKGIINIESSIGKGSIFTIILPLK